MTASTVKLRATAPVVPVPDIAEARDFYGQQLGFAVQFETGDYNRLTFVQSS